MILVAYDPDQPELMEQLAEHWDKGITVTKSERVKARVMREWKAGNCKIYVMKEVFECLTKISNGD